jgi:hypothetical protein
VNWLILIRANGSMIRDGKFPDFGVEETALREIFIVKTHLVRETEAAFVQDHQECLERNRWTRKRYTEMTKKPK